MSTVVKKRAGLIAVSVLGILIIIMSIFAGILFGTNIIQKAIIRFMCQDSPSSLPKNYEQILNSTNLSTIEYTDGVFLDVIEPKNLADDAICFLVFHGGYYIGGGRHNQEPFARLIASYGYRVLNIDYSLAPEHKYPTQLTQANLALNYAQNAYPNSKGFIVSGDSAGAHLAGQLTALVMNDALKSKLKINNTINSEKLIGFVGSCGFYQVSAVKETKFFLIDNAMQLLTGKRNYKESSIIAELDIIDYASSFPKTMLICGDKDPFIGQNVAMYETLISKIVNVEIYFPSSNSNDLGHEFQCNYNLEESYTATDKIIEFLRSLE